MAIASRQSPPPARRFHIHSQKRAAMETTLLLLAFVLVPVLVLIAIILVLVIKILDRL
jgi:hypothetical protein